MEDEKVNWLTISIGKNHPLRIAGIGHGSSHTPGTSTSRSPWPNSHSANQALGAPVRVAGYSTLRPLVLPKFVIKPELPLKMGYQEAHELYHEMRLFFAQKASTVHNNEVVIIKVTMMMLKPNCKVPSVVSVRKFQIFWTSTQASNSFTIEHFRDDWKYSSAYRSQSSKGCHVLYASSALRWMVQRIFTSHW